MQVEFTGDIDRDFPVPFYFQLLQLLEKQLRSGKWNEGDRLPSEPALCDRFGVSRSVVRQTLTALEQEGLLRREKGRGAFVTSRREPYDWYLQTTAGFHEDERERAGLTVTSEVMRMETKKLPDWAADALELDSGAPGIVLERLRFVDGEVVMYVVNYLPTECAAACRRVHRDPSKSLYDAILSTTGRSIVSSARGIEAVYAADRLTQLLEVPMGFPLLHIESVSRDREHRAIDCYHAWLRSDRIKVAMSVDSEPADAGVAAVSTDVGSAR